MPPFLIDPEDSHAKLFAESISLFLHHFKEARRKDSVRFQLSIFCRALLSQCQNGRESCDKRSRTNTLIIASTIIRIVNINKKLTLVDAFA